MNKTKLDLRKVHPLGREFDEAYRRACSYYAQWQNMGEPDKNRPGYREHCLERNRLAKETLDFVNLARLVAYFAGPKAFFVPALRWAVLFDGLGVQPPVRSEAAAQAEFTARLTSSVLCS